MSLPINTPEVLEHLLQKAEALKAAQEAIAAFIG